MEKLSLKKAAPSDRAAVQRLQALESQLESERRGGASRGEGQGLFGLLALGSAARSRRPPALPHGLHPAGPSRWLRCLLHASFASSMSSPTQFLVSPYLPRFPPSPPAAGLKAEQAELTQQWERERDDLSKVQRVKEEIDRVNIEIAQVGQAGGNNIQGNIQGDIKGK